MNDTQLFRVGILTVSDKGHAGERHDASGPELARMLPAADFQVAATAVVPDELEAITAQLLAWCDRERLNLILTTGGTGLSPRDLTPEATLAVAQREVPGLPEAMRAAGLAQPPRAMLSRGVAVLRGCTLIVNLPGSPKGAGKPGRHPSLLAPRPGETGRQPPGMRRPLRAVFSFRKQYRTCLRDCQRQSGKMGDRLRQRGSGGFGGRWRLVFANKPKADSLTYCDA